MLSCVTLSSGRMVSIAHTLSPWGACVCLQLGLERAHKLVQEGHLDEREGTPPSPLLLWAWL